MGDMQIPQRCACHEGASSVLTAATRSEHMTDPTKSQTGAITRRQAGTAVTAAVFSSILPTATPAQGVPRMTPIVAKGTFTVEMNPQADPRSANGVSLARMSLAKRFEGDLVGASQGDMLTAMTPVKGSAGYVAIE